MNAHPGDPDGGWWVPTFASDCRPGDTIRLADDAPRRLVVDRDDPPAWARNIRVVLLDGVEVIGRTQPVEIWDTDGRIAQRVQDLSARAVR